MLFIMIFAACCARIIFLQLDEPMVTIRIRDDTSEFSDRKSSVVSLMVL